METTRSSHKMEVRITHHRTCGSAYGGSYFVSVFVQAFPHGSHVGYLQHISHHFVKKLQMKTQDMWQKELTYC